MESLSACCHPSLPLFPQCSPHYPYMGSWVPTHCILNWPAPLSPVLAVVLLTRPRPAPASAPPPRCVISASFLFSPPFFSTQSNENTSGVRQAHFAHRGSDSTDLLCRRPALPCPQSRNFQVDHPIYVLGTPQCSGSVYTSSHQARTLFSQPCLNLLKFFPC